VAAAFRGLTVPVGPLAHSARQPEAEAQTYHAHIMGTPSSDGVAEGAARRAEAMVRYHRDRSTGAHIAAAVVDAATFHDLGKLDPEIQAALHQGRDARLRWDHIDAGVAHLRAQGAAMAAWMVRAHHAPGLPSRPIHFTSRDDPRLRGRRDDNDDLERHREQIQRTDSLLSELVAAHEAVIGARSATRNKALHGLPMRLAVSCLVDADHSDTAYADTEWLPPEPPMPRWPERLASLDAYVAGLGSDVGQRNALRAAFYDECRHREPDQALIACEGPVGIGKTTAVLAYCLRRAIATGARRVFVVAPYTAILSQTADRLRKALVLKDECQPDAIVAEHHHRAEFGDISSRDLAMLWTAPIILTTAVQFFETLASSAPTALRKLHALPGSVVFLDEAHAALPTHLWPQNWKWLRQLADDWSCSFVFASGSLARFWEVEDIVGDDLLKLGDLVPAALVAPLRQAEAARVHYVSLGRLDGPARLADAVQNVPGPRLLIMNTVQSAAVMARLMRNRGHDVLHISTALCPRDRAPIMAVVQERLNTETGYPDDWTLIATSLMEAGIDVSFRSPFRERFATASLIQVGGRGNRNFEWPDGVTVHDFVVDAAEGLKAHPAAVVPASILERLFLDGRLDGEADTAELVTESMRRELRRRRSAAADELLSAERDGCYPDVARLGRVITADTRLVVVDPVLRERILVRAPVRTRELLAGSVQIYAYKIRELGLESLLGRQGVFWWPQAYDPTFLGYMEGALSLAAIAAGEAIII